MSKPGRILNDSWVCRLGCYHNLHDIICDCRCHTIQGRFTGQLTKGRNGN